MADITSTKKEDLVKELTDKRKGLHDFRFSLAGAAKRNVKEARDLRRSISRILTELTRRTLSK